MAGRNGKLIYGSSFLVLLLLFCCCCADYRSGAVLVSFRYPRCMGEELTASLENVFFFLFLLCPFKPICPWPEIA